MVHKQKALKWVLISIVIGASSSIAIARDISPEQRAASEARKAYNRAKNNYHDLTKKVADQEKRVADEQAKLAALKAEHADTEKVIEIRRQDLDRKVQRLNEVWDERTR